VCEGCPTDVNNVTCSGNGICNCNSCICFDSLNVTGFDCSTPTGPGQYTQCAECKVNGFTWCNILGIEACKTSDECAVLGQVIDSCEYVSPLTCPDDCICVPSNNSHGVCVISDGIAQCVCDKKWHGGSCCVQGGLSKGAIAGIAAGTVAAIVICAVVAFAVLGYAAKRTVDWVALKNQNMAAAQNNPMFKPKTTEHENPLHNDSPKGSPRK
jgi:hypothetical protein